MYSVTIIKTTTTKKQDFLCVYTFFDAMCIVFHVIIQITLISFMQGLELIQPKHTERVGYL